MLMLRFVQPDTWINMNDHHGKFLVEVSSVCDVTCIRVSHAGIAVIFGLCHQYTGVTSRADAHDVHTIDNPMESEEDAKEDV
jgi:hypothetical protein